SSVRTTQSTAYAPSSTCATVSAIGFVARVSSTVLFTRNTTNTRSASAHSTKVAETPKRPSRRLPASNWAEPGISRLSATSHHALAVMTSRELVSGWRTVGLAECTLRAADATG